MAHIGQGRGDVNAGEGVGGVGQLSGEIAGPARRSASKLSCSMASARSPAWEMLGVQLSQLAGGETDLVGGGLAVDEQGVQGGLHQGVGLFRAVQSTK